MKKVFVFEGKVKDVTRCWFDFTTRAGSSLTFLFIKPLSPKIRAFLENNKHISIGVRGIPTTDIGIYSFVNIFNTKDSRIARKYHNRAISVQNIFKDVDPNWVRPKLSSYGAGNQGPVSSKSSAENLVTMIEEHAGIVRPIPKCPRKIYEDPVLLAKRRSEAANRAWETRRKRELERQDR